MAFDGILFQGLLSELASSGVSGAEAFLKSSASSFDSELDSRLSFQALKMLIAVAEGRKAEAFDLFLEASSLKASIPEPMLVMAMHLACQTGREQDLALPIFNFASEAADLGRSALALEYVKRIYNVAHSGRNAAFLYEPDSLMKVAGLLERTAAPWLSRAPGSPLGPAKLKPRLAIVTVNMNEGITAWVKTAIQFSRYADRSKYDVYEYLVDEVAERKQASLDFKFTLEDSERLAPKAMAEMRRDGSQVKCVPLDKDWMEGSLWLAEEMERDQIDAAVFQGNVGNPMMWMAARLAQLPVKITLCIGFNMYQPGQSATIYMSNSINMKKESAFWRPEWGRQVFMAGGADIKQAARTEALKREDYAIPKEAVAFGMLSNYVDARVTEEYLSCVVRVLRSCPEAIFVCMGAGDPSKQIGYMERAGLIDRCRWLSWQHLDSFASLKLLDFYYNEIPVGGAQAVIECLACGIPATAMLYSQKHHESVGADIVGPEFAVMERSLDKYVERAVEWVRSPESRSKAAKALFSRVSGMYSAEAFIKELCEFSMEQRKAKG